MRTMSDNKIEIHVGVCSPRQRRVDGNTDSLGSDQEIKQHFGYSDQELNWSPTELMTRSKGVTNWREKGD